MTIQWANDFGAGLSTALANLTCPVAKSDYRTTPRKVRLGVAVADLVQTVCVGIAVHAAVAGHDLGLLKVFVLGLLVAGIAVTARRSIRSAGTPGKSSVLPLSTQAALSTLASVCAAGAICGLLAPRATTEFIVTWFAACAAVSSLLSATLRVAAGDPPTGAVACP